MSGPSHVPRGKGIDRGRQGPATAESSSSAVSSEVSLPGPVSTKSQGTDFFEGLNVGYHDGLTPDRIKQLGVRIDQREPGRAVLSFDPVKLYGPTKEFSFDPGSEKLEFYARGGTMSIFIVSPNDRRQCSDGTIDRSSCAARVISFAKDDYLGTLHVPGHYSEHLNAVRVKPGLRFKTNPGIDANLYQTLAELRRRGVSIDAECGMLRLHGQKEVRLQTREGDDRFAALSLSEIPFSDKLSCLTLSIEEPSAQSGAGGLRSADIMIGMQHAEPVIRRVTVKADGSILIGPEKSSEGEK